MEIHIKSISAEIMELSHCAGDTPEFPPSTPGSDRTGGKTKDSSSWSGNIHGYIWILSINTMDTMALQIELKGKQLCNRADDPRVW